MTIIDPKYKGRPKKDDFVAKLIDANCVDTDEDGKNAHLNVDSLLALAEANFADVGHLEKHKELPNGVGRLRMTIGNMLRSRAKKRHGLFNLDGDWQDAPSDFIDGHPKTEMQNGDKIKAQKEESEAA